MPFSRIAQRRRGKRDRSPALRGSQTVPKRKYCRFMLSKCLIADSLTAVSAPGFRFTGFRASIAKVAALPCDIVVAVHPAFTNLASKLKQRAGKPAADPFIDPQGCRAYAADALKRLEARVAEERR